MQEEIDSFEKKGRTKNQNNRRNQPNFQQRNRQGGQPRFQLR